MGVIDKDDLFCADGRAFNFPVDHLCRFQLPEGFKLSGVAAMFETSRWYTYGHVEICGDDSIACTALGKKVFVYATSIRATIWLINQTKDSDSFRKFAQKEGVIPLQPHHYTSGAGAVLHTLNAGTEAVFVFIYIYLLRNYCLSPLSLYIDLTGT